MADQPTMQQVMATSNPTQAMRRVMAAQGWAMPDGSFYIRPLPRGRSDLSNAIRAVGRGTPGENQSEEARRNAIRRHCIKRARALGLTDMIPDTWNADGSLKQWATDLEDFLAHYGVKGMRWGVRKSEPSASSPRSVPRLSSSHDAAVAARLQSRVNRAGSTRTLSNAELKQLVTRLNLESQYSNLSRTQVNAGQKIATEILVNSGKQLASQFIVQNAPKAAKYVAKKLGVLAVRALVG